MEIEKSVSIASIALSSESEKPIPHKSTLRRFQSYVNTSGAEFQPFKLLYKCIHPESPLPSSKLPNSSKLYSEAPSLKATSFREDLQVLNKQQESEPAAIDVNAVQSVVLSRMGLRNFDGMENQDVVLQQQISNNCKIYGIFDGHGEHGKVIAEAASAIFKRMLLKYTEEIKNENSILSIETIIRKVLEKTNSFILHYHVEEAQFSGCTALLLVITTSKIYAFNLGNSRVVLAKHFQKTGRIEPFQLTHDHTIARFDERARVLANGGVIAPYRSEGGEQLGPERVWAKNETYPGMFITRTLGLSCAHKIGVLSQPEVSVVEYKAAYKYLIMASDGFWSVEENDQAVKFLENCKIEQMEKLGAALMGEAVRRWNSRSVLMDDITLIIIYLA